MFAFDFLACLGRQIFILHFFRKNLTKRKLTGMQTQSDRLQGVVDDVRERKTGSSLGIGLDTEGVACAGNEVEHETGDIGNGVGRGGQYMVVAA